MAQSIVRHESPEEREYNRYRVEIESRQRRIADLQADLAAVKQKLGLFELEYHARVGRLFVELDRVHLAIAQYEQRMARLKAKSDTDPDEVEEEIQHAFEKQEEQVRAEERDEKRYERAFVREQERPQLAPEGEFELRRLFRDLAKRHHPDLARTDEERQRREAIMQRINAAFRERDLATLRALDQEAATEDPAFEAQSIGTKLVWAIREVARLDQVITELEAERVAVEATDIHGLWARQNAGEDVIGVLEGDLSRELTAERGRLAELIATYRQLIERRAS